MFTAQKTVVMFSGGGFFFWWQAGVFHSLRLKNKQKMDLACFCGCSCGAIMAALACCDVKINKAKATALRIAGEKKIWSSKIRMISHIADSVREFLQELLPANACDLCRNRLKIYVTRVRFTSCPTLSCQEITQFNTKDDIIDACLASIHIPFVVDGRATFGIGNERFVDGSLLSPKAPQGAIVVDSKYDENMKGSMLGNYTQDDFSEMIKQGMLYAEKMH